MSYSESTYGQKYTKAHAIVEHLKVISGYAPSNPSITPSSLTAFLSIVQNANDTVASKYGLLQDARSERLDLYHSDNGLLRRCRQIRDYVATLSSKGEDSRIARFLKRAIQRMVDYKPSRKTPQLPASPDVVKEESISTSERSFGSLARVGREILENISLVSNYVPSNQEITIASMGSLLDKIEAKNNEIASKLAEYDEVISARAELYEQLDFLVKQIKLALSGQYGKTSFEYKEVVKIRY